MSTVHSVAKPRGNNLRRQRLQMWVPPRLSYLSDCRDTVARFRLAPEASRKIKRTIPIGAFPTVAILPYLTGAAVAQPGDAHSPSTAIPVCRWGFGRRGLLGEAPHIQHCGWVANILMLRRAAGISVAVLEEIAGAASRVKLTDSSLRSPELPNRGMTCQSA
jgi:hypothetical protein